MKTWKWAVLVLGCMMLLVGCEQLYQQVADPNSGLNVGVDTVAPILPVVGGAAAATGTPWGVIVALGAGILTAVIEEFRIYRKKNDLRDIEVTTKAIIDAVESVGEVDVGANGETIGKIIKAEVKEKLKDASWYKVGKIIITELKN